MAFTTIAQGFEKVTLEYSPIKQIQINTPITCGVELMSELNDLLDYQELTRNENANSQGQPKQGKEDSNE